MTSACRPPMGRIHCHCSIYSQSTSSSQDWTARSFLFMFDQVSKYSSDLERVVLLAQPSECWDHNEMSSDHWSESGSHCLVGYCLDVRVCTTPFYGICPCLSLSQTSWCYTVFWGDVWPSLTLPCVYFSCSLGDQGLWGFGGSLG